MGFNPKPFNLVAGFENWLQVFGIVAAVGLVLGLALSFASGGERGGSLFGRGLLGYVIDLVTISPRRIFAITWLTLKEAVRRKALLVFVVFAILLMFAGWFLTNSNDRSELQVNVHIPFMLTSITWLLLPVMIFLSCWGIPEDIRIRSLHTVVTKPVRRAEVVIGRMLGFVALGATVLILMGTIGYFWITRQVDSTQTVLTTSGEVITGDVLSSDEEQISIRPTVGESTETVQIPQDEIKELQASAREKYLTCRVPVYGSLYFLDQTGTPQNRGINVGDAWEYRSFVTGNSPSRAVWRFRDVTADRFGQGEGEAQLHLESRFEAFRTVKGTDKSQKFGMEAQYTLVHNLREGAFSTIGRGASFRVVGDYLRDGEFVQAAEEFRTMADRMASSPGDFPRGDCIGVVQACANNAIPAMQTLGFESVARAFEELGKTAFEVANGDKDQGAAARYEAMADATRALADEVETNAEAIFEAMPRIEVPLPPFYVTEYHVGSGHVYDRKQKYIADYEGTARFIATATESMIEAGTFVENGELSSSLVEQYEAAGLSELNAELVAEVLQEQLDNGAIKLDGDSPSPTEGSWLTFLYRLAREEELISQDVDGWQLECDIFDDLVFNDELRVEVSCLNDQFYLGMARPDLFLRMPDNPFSAGYSKAMLNIGLMLALITIIGVTASCVVKGPVAFFFTLSVFFVGQFFHPLMDRISTSNARGLGAVESAVMIAQHRNESTGIDANDSTQKAITALDWASKKLVSVARNVVPDFSQFGNSSEYLSKGFDVPWNSSILPALMTFLGFFLPCIIIATACLKFRELEAK